MTAAVPDKPDRVLGWDVLRGLCALAVASYHLLSWQDLAHFHTLGTYGVYLFFVLSGASLAYNYSGKLRGAGDAAAFLFTRWLRLAPLYFLLCLVFVVLIALNNGQWLDRLPLRLSLNATFLFGAHNPVIWALLIGGWSLGIEFIYYLAFPFLLPALPRVPASALLGAALCLVQWWWIQHTVGSEAGYLASSIAYHQLPAFVAYFFGGCVIGHWRRLHTRALPLSAGVLAWLLTALVLLALNPREPGDELFGWRGPVLFCLCFAAVFASGQVAVGRSFARVAQWLGDITYGCYLLHPIFFFSFVWFALPYLGVSEAKELPLAMRWLVLACVLALSCLGAAASDRWFEAPIRRWGKRMVKRRRSPAGYSEATSISS